MANIYWVGGTGTWNTSSTTNWASSSGGTGGTGTVPTAADNVFFDSGSGTPGTVTMTGALLCLNITVSVTGWTFATGTTPTLAISGNLALTSGTTWTSTGTITFNSTASQTITTASTAFSCGITFDGVGGTWQLQDALTIGSGRTVTLTNGTLDLNSNTLTTGVFSSSNSNTRTLAFGTTGRIVLTGLNTTIWTTSTTTGLTYSGTLSIDVTGAGTAGQTRTIIYNTGAYANNTLNQLYAANFRVTAGVDTVNFGARLGGCDFTGFNGTLGLGNFLSYGSVIFSSGMTVAPSTGAVSFLAETGSYTIQTNGVVFDRVVGLNNGSTTGTATYTLLDNFTVLSGTSSGTISFATGTVNLNNNNITCAIFTSSNSNTRTLAFGTGTIAVTGSGATAWNCTTATNLTTTGTGTISMTSASAKTFVGGFASYAATLDQGGAGALTITGSNTFRNITASIAPTSAASIVFTAGRTTSLTTGFDVDGTAANAITVSSDVAAVHTLSLASGTVVANYLNLSYSTATGGAAWYLASNSTNGGNLTGWQSIQGTAVVSIGQGIAIQHGVVFS